MRLPSLVYIAGRLSADTTEEIYNNINRAALVSAMVIDCGDDSWFPMTPHTMTSAIWQKVKEHQYKGCACDDDVWYKGTLSLLACCDGMIVLPGFAESEGTQGEILFAKDNGIPYSILQPPTMEPECFTLLQVRKALSDIENQILDRGE